jgi:hypothetical protein
MTLTPVSKTVSLVGPVIRVACHLLALPKVLPGTLASRFVAETLVLDVRIGRKQTPAMGTSDLTAHGSTSIKTMNLSEGPQDGRIRTRIKVNGKKKESVHAKRGKKIHLVYFYPVPRSTSSPLILAPFLAGGINLQAERNSQGC